MAEEPIGQEGIQENQSGKISKGDVLKSGWGERLITTGVLAGLPYLGISSTKLIQILSPIGTGVIVISISLLVAVAKDSLYEKRKESEIKRGEDDFNRTVSQYESLLQNIHLNEDRRSEIREDINIITNERRTEIKRVYGSRKMPEIYSKLGETLDSIQNAISNTPGK